MRIPRNAPPSKPPLKIKIEINVPLTLLSSFYVNQRGKFKPVNLIDVPGHSRLRPKLDEYLPQAAGLIFVVDALEFLPNFRAASE